MFSHQTPAVISHHMRLPTTLISVFHDFNALVELLTLFVANISQVVWKRVQVTVYVVQFDVHSAPELS
uniref:Uncharacterized protein n=1 Tax=Lepeophtheirus salmonis TaxID=72036 RepID=A0A0K2T705_LEPSM